MSVDMISNHEVIPEVESSVFNKHGDAQLAVGIVAIGDDIVSGLENEFNGYQLLRGNVYAKQKGYMPEDELNLDGTETDPDDVRSIHFAVIENAMHSPRVVGAMRLIIKARRDEATMLAEGVATESPLPIEAHYPEAFANNPASLPSTESSRLIARHENSKLQRSIKWLLFTAGVSYVLEHNLGPNYGAVERSLARSLQIEGTPLVELAPAKFVEEFNATKLPIRIDVEGLAQKIENDQPGALNEAQKSDFMYARIAQPVEASQPVAAA